MELLEQMRLKAWLSQAQVGYEVNALENSVERMRARVVGGTLDGVERYGALVAAYISELQANAADVRAAIARVSDETQRRVLILRYCEGLTWEAISDTTNYCCVHLHRIHRAALSSVKAILETQDEPAHF